MEQKQIHNNTDGWAIHLPKIVPFREYPKETIDREDRFNWRMSTKKKTKNTTVVLQKIAHKKGKIQQLYKIINLGPLHVWVFWNSECRCYYK